MNCLSAFRIPTNTRNEYATREDVRRLFTDHVRSLYLLSFLLTANHEKAEQCFVAGLDECMTGNPIFQEWARTWARRIIVRNAIQMIAPRIDSARAARGAFHSPGGGVPATMSSQDLQFADILMLEDFERFVYVLSILEKYSDQDCAILLGVSRQDIRVGRTHAFQQIADYSRVAAAPANDLLDAVMN